ncbi:hypothetical protein AAVH_37532, partial [Aphelenchoides avenae]
MPMKVNSMESLVYTIDVVVGSQRFNLTLDTTTQESVLFSKDFVATKHPCSMGDAHRNLFDPSLSKSFEVIDRVVGLSSLDDYPYGG